MRRLFLASLLLAVAACAQQPPPPPVAASPPPPPPPPPPPTTFTVYFDYDQSEMVLEPNADFWRAVNQTPPPAASS